MPGESVLIIEDDPALLRGVKDNFVAKGYCVRTATDGEQGLELAANEKPDLIVLDIMLPKINGYEICRHLRESGLTMPILMLTAKGQESDICLGLNLGADDYMCKPFSIKELLARANALLRRRRSEHVRVFNFGPFVLSLDSRKLHREGHEIALTPREFDLLALLAQRPGRAMTREEILRRVWGFKVFVGTRSVDRCVTTLRAKIETDPARPLYLRTVREIGYRFDPEPDV
jgi:DNA-binding response OmpR family regulator